MKSNIWNFLAFLSLVLLFSCQNKEQPEASLNDVQFAIPDKLEIPYEQASVSFRVQFGKAPKTGDYMVFGSLPACPIGSITESSFSVDISKLWGAGLASGEYAITLTRGSQSQKKGTVNIVVKAPVIPGEEVTPAAGSTVYGKVICNGTGIAGAVVSDGVAVVKTDKDGVYQLASKKKHGYVFVSVPSGYEPARNGILPMIHQQLTEAASVPERIDFALKKADGQENHTMLMLGDIHLANRTNDRNQFKNFVDDINALVAATSGKVYAMTLGDMTWDLYWVVNSYGYKEYLKDAAAIKDLTIYQTIGNHDHSMYEIGDVNTVKEYKEEVAPTYYSFNIGQVHYVVLDDVECTNSTATTDDKGNPCYKRTYNGNVVQEQYDWLQKDLSFVPTSTPLVVTMHIPLYKANGKYNLMNNATLEAILKPYSEVHLFTAHTHTCYNIDNLSGGHIFEHNAGAICGTWWWSAQETAGVHIGQDGSPGGYTIMKVAGTSFSWQFKGTGMDVNKQMRAYDRNTIHLTADKYVSGGNQEHKNAFEPDIWSSANSSNEVYVNVWNWDPSWKVEVSEGGNPLTVTQVTVKDPLHLVAYTAKRLNKNATATFATESNRHMFKVTASSASSTLDIKVTDRFGNVYTESMTRPLNFSTDTYKH